MYRTAIVAAALVALAGMSCARREPRGNPPPYRFGPPEASLGKQEFVFIRITEDAEKRCKVVDKTPAEIRTELGARIVWQIEGSCGTSRIAIAPEFKGGGQKHQIVTGLSADGVPAASGQRITATVPKDLAPGLLKKVYRFEILIDGRSAEFNPRADDGYFFLCPIWPCGDFEAF